MTVQVITQVRYRPLPGETVLLHQASVYVANDETSPAGPEMMTIDQLERLGRTLYATALQLRAVHHPEALTARERQVLDALTIGASNLDIAADLHISRSTVGTHVRNILRKLDVHSRLAAVNQNRARRGPDRSQRTAASPDRHWES